MPKFSFIRAFANLRRVALELKRSNDLAEARLNLEHPDWRRRAHSAKLKSMSSASIERWNRQYLDRHPPAPEE